MAQQKRGWKLQEFLAHGANVQCLALGHKSSRVMVSGGEDRKVNLWAVGKPNCIMTLTGHTTTVSAVRFGNAEEMVVAGSQSGALKVWDLEQAKIMRTLTGHTAGVNALDFHPFAEFVGSGALDSNIKLWDIRRKGCIKTYKGHANGVNCLRFSPDGKWIASAGGDGIIKLWDLAAGKLVADLKLHQGPVNVVEFHPNEVLLASASSDKTVKFWDLETLKLVSSSDKESKQVSSMWFHPEGKCLYAGAEDSLKVYGWEPYVCYDSVPLVWGAVSDISFRQDQLIGVAFSQLNVSVHVVDLSKVRPMGVNSEPDIRPSLSSSGRRSFMSDRPPTSSARQSSVNKEDEESSVMSDNVEDNRADIQNEDDYKELFRTRSKIARSPVRHSEPFKPPFDDEERKRQIAEKQRLQDKQRLAEKQKELDRQNELESERKKKEEERQRVIDQKRKEQQDRERKQKQQQQQQSNDSLGSIDKGHTAMLTVMSSRSRNLQIVRAMWTSGNTKTAVDSAISMNDQAVMVDILNVLNFKPTLWTLDLCSILLPQLKDLLNSKYECYVTTTCQSLKLILKNMGPVIKANISSAPSIGVDISREERHQKCNACYQTLMAVRTLIEKRQAIPGKLGNMYKQLQILMGTLD
ncbi:hypothetical protein LOTGIDRAFT_191659 [Lottia gigantea]|uniref:Katanin p80 WD40 repeat-containing subunit B1 n=1 Tax=Lottia gigantea TaxID=225164 RepID=V3ZHU4_LOTGI|nr:hypothetical protein LOTGIDRAFT_191659 [Lottia gigantea]ESO90828.1 hypothetical protein LOTGIDRAFT_191659 [Lottia gigantea]